MPGTTPRGRPPTQPPGRPRGRPPTQGLPREGAPPINPGVVLDLPSWEEAMDTAIPTMKHVPKSARAEWRQTLDFTLREVNAASRYELPWRKKYILARCILSARPGEQGATGGRSAGTRVKEACIRWRRGEEALLWAEAKGAIKPQGRRQGRAGRGRGRLHPLQPRHCRHQLQWQPQPSKVHNMAYHTC